MPSNREPGVPTEPTPPRALHVYDAASEQRGAEAVAAWNYAKTQDPTPGMHQMLLALNYMRQQNPTLPVPPGFELNRQGQIQEDRGAWLARNWSYLALAGVWGAGAVAALTAGGTPALASTAASSTTAGGSTALAAVPWESTVPAVATGGGGAVPFGATAGGYALRYGLGPAAGLAGSAIQAHAASQAQDAQQHYLDQALAYEKEKDAYDRKVAEDARALEQQRYGDREGRLAPYRATGAASNASMAAFLGLPAPADGGLPAPKPFTPTTPLPYAPAVQPDRTTASAAPGAPATPASSGPLVTVRAPTGATRQVPESQVSYWQSRGATVVEGAAA